MDSLTPFLQVSRSPGESPGCGEARVLRTPTLPGQVEGRDHMCSEENHLLTRRRISNSRIRNQKFGVKIQKSSGRANFPSHLATPFDAIVC